MPGPAQEDELLCWLAFFLCKYDGHGPCRGALRERMMMGIGGDEGGEGIRCGVRTADNAWRTNRREAHHVLWFLDLCRRWRINSMV